MTITEKETVSQQVRAELEDAAADYRQVWLAGPRNEMEARAAYLTTVVVLHSMAERLGLDMNFAPFWRVLGETRIRPSRRQ